MAVLSITDQLTSLEVAKRSGFSPDSRRIIEQLNAYNELLIDAPIVEANEGTVDTHLVRTAIPHGELRGYNEGVGKGSSQTKTIKDVIANYEIYSEVDKQMIDEAAHPQEILQSEQNAFIEGLSQDITSSLIYGNHEADARDTNGFAVRLNDTQSGQSKKVISLQSTVTTGLTSVYLIKWGMDKARIISPRGAKNAGVQYDWLGQQTKAESSTKSIVLTIALHAVYLSVTICQLSVSVISTLTLQTLEKILHLLLLRLCHILHVEPELSLLLVTQKSRD